MAWVTPTGWVEGWEDPLDGVLAEIVEALSAFDASIEQGKLVKQMKGHFTKSRQNLTMSGKEFDEIVNEYVDASFNSLFASLGDKEWLYTGQVDLCDVVVAGVKNFPAKFIRNVDQATIEPIARAAHDRSFDECRVNYMMTSAVKDAVQGPKTIRKVYTAVEQGRKDALQEQGNIWCAVGPMESFACRWIDRSIYHLAKVLDGYPDSAMDMDTASKLFHKMIEDQGALPLWLTQEHGTPCKDWVLIDAAINESYLAYSAAPEGDDAEPKQKKAKITFPEAGGKGGWDGGKGGKGAWDASSAKGGWNSGGAGGAAGGGAAAWGGAGAGAAWNAGGGDIMSQMMTMFGGAGGGAGKGW